MGLIRRARLIIPVEMRINNIYKFHVTVIRIISSEKLSYMRRLIHMISLQMLVTHNFILTNYDLLYGVSSLVKHRVRKCSNCGSKLTEFSAYIPDLGEACMKCFLEYEKKDEEMRIHLKAIIK